MACATHAVLSPPAVERIESFQNQGSGADQLDSAVGGGAPVEQASGRCRWLRCWRGPSSRSTRRPASARCLFEDGRNATHVQKRTCDPTAVRGSLNEMMRRDITVAAEPRAARGKNEARRLRAARPDPGRCLRRLQEPLAVAVDPKEVTRILHSKSGHNTIFNVERSGGRDHPGHDRGLAVRPGQGQPAARGFEAHRPDQAPAGLRPGGNARRAQGRQAAGRIAGDGHPRDRDRVPAGRDSRALRPGRHRADDRPEPARRRRAF